MLAADARQQGSGIVMLRVTVAVLVVGLLAACAAEVKGPSAKIAFPEVKVGSTGGGFCPPGQAKKGNC